MGWTRCSRLKSRTHRATALFEKDTEHDLTDQLRTAVGNQLGPVPKAELDAMTPSQLRPEEPAFEEAAGWAKPLAQFYNVITPAAVEGMVIGIPNALSKLANASMDEAAERLTGKPWDNEPAWQLPQDPLKRINPYREGDMGDTPADRPGFEFGAEAAGGWLVSSLIRH